MTRLGVIGVGRMGSALIHGVLNSPGLACQIKAYDHHATPDHPLKQILCASIEEALDCDVLLLAIKPQSFKELVLPLAPSGTGLISIMTGITTTALQARFPHQEIVRAMPNTPLMVQSGFTGLYGHSISKSLHVFTEQLFGNVGQIMWLEQETAIDALTAISGSGPAYVFHLMEAMMEAALEMHFSPTEAHTMVLETVLGAAKLAASSKQPFTELKHQVTSKGGTTEAALRILDDGQVRPNIVKALHAAYARAKILGASH